jgi:hypothetical protein
MAFQTASGNARQNRFIQVAESTFMVPNIGGVPVFRRDMVGDGAGLSTPQVWREHRPEGENHAFSANLVGMEGIVTRDFEPHYRSMEYIFRHQMGAPISDTLIDANARRKIVWVDPHTNSPAIETISAYYGLPSGSNRLTGGKLMGWNIDTTRNGDAGTLGGSITYHFNRVEYNVAVPGTVVANEVKTITTGTGNASYTVPTTSLGAGGTLAITNGDAAATVETALQAIAGYDDAGVTVGKVGGVYTITFAGALAQEDIGDFIKVGGTGWTDATTVRGSDGDSIFYPTGPSLEADHHYVFRATDEDDLDTIDVTNLPDEYGNGGDPHLMLGAYGSGLSVGDLWNVMYSLNGKKYATDFAAGARTFGGFVRVPNDESVGSDNYFLRHTEDGCEALGFMLKYLWMCGGYELHIDKYVVRNAEPGMGNDNDVWTREYGIGRIKNPDSNISWRATLILPV